MAKIFGISQRMSLEKSMKLRTWAINKGLSKKDINMLYQISSGLVKGKYGRGKELIAMLEQEGVKVNVSKDIKNKSL